MKLTYSPSIAATDTLVVLLNTPQFDAKDYALAAPESLAAVLNPMMGKGGFDGKPGSVCASLVPMDGVKRLELVALKPAATKQHIREAARKAAMRARAIGAASVTVLAPTSMCLEMLTSGALAGNYTYKVGETPKEGITEVCVITDKTVSQDWIDQQLAEAAAVSTIRRMVDTPANHMRPAHMAAESVAVGKINADMKVTVFGEKELKENKFEALLEVGRGSDSESHVAIFEYNGGAAGDAPLAFIGKGVAYDTGGYNLKPTGHIETMKCDMGGAATVVGLMEYIARTAPKVNVVGIIGCVQNDISGHAYYPGDVIQCRKGKTIEVTNTDAEGRLVLADCIDYIREKHSPKTAYTAATLTGAVTHAVGLDITGVCTNAPDAFAQMHTMAEVAGEPIWQLPLNEALRDNTKGSISDLKNWTKGARMGSSMAAAFLWNFMEDTPWVHADIAGTAFNGKYGTGGEEGATGTLLATWRRVVEDAA